MASGTVKFFNESKGFGFITPTSGGKEVFVHVTGLIDKIRENDEVTYEVEEGKKGPSAVGESATRAVVSGILLVIIADAVVAVILYFLHL